MSRHGQATPRCRSACAFFPSPHAQRWGTRRAKGLRLGFWRQKYSYDAGWFGMGAGCSEADHDPCREAKIILRDSENMSEQPVSLHSPSHPFDQLVIKPAPDVFGK